MMHPPEKTLLRTQSSSISASTTTETPFDSELGDGQTGPVLIDIEVAYMIGAAEERALVRKIDLYLMPILFLMYTFNFMDRSNIGTPPNE